MADAGQARPRPTTWRRTSDRRAAAQPAGEDRVHALARLFDRPRNWRRSVRTRDARCSISAVISKDCGPSPLAMMIRILVLLAGRSHRRLVPPHREAGHARRLCAPGTWPSIEIVATPARSSGRLSPRRRHRICASIPSATSTWLWQALQAAPTAAVMSPASAACGHRTTYNSATRRSAVPRPGEGLDVRINRRAFWPLAVDVELVHIPAAGSLDRAARSDRVSARVWPPGMPPVM